MGVMGVMGFPARVYAHMHPRACMHAPALAPAPITPITPITK